MAIPKARDKRAAYVVKHRDEKGLSWAQIAAKLDVSPGTARRLYDEVKGEGAHHGLLPGKGGRVAADEQETESKSSKAA